MAGRLFSQRISKLFFWQAFMGLLLVEEPGELLHDFVREVVLRVDRDLHVGSTGFPSHANTAKIIRESYEDHLRNL